MDQKQATQGLRRFASKATLTIAAILIVGAGVWFGGRHLSAHGRWLPLSFGGLVVVVFLVILVHSVHEEHVIKRTVIRISSSQIPLLEMWVMTSLGKAPIAPRRLGAALGRTAATP